MGRICAYNRDMTAITDLRHDLVTVLERVGPGLPTLCEGWNTEHMLAHLILRETRPDIAAGVVLPPLSKRTEAKTEELAEELSDGHAFSDGLATFEAARPLTRRHDTADENVNYLEYIVHREDILRGSPEAVEMNSGRTADPEEQQKIWKALDRRAALMAKDYPDGLTLVGTDDQGAPRYGTSVVRKSADSSRVSGLVQKVVRSPRTGDAAVLTGEPLELLMYLFGRRDAARVEVSY